jgi:hypothetical protein
MMNAKASDWLWRGGEGGYASGEERHAGMITQLKRQKAQSITIVRYNFRL